MPPQAIPDQWNLACSCGRDTLDHTPNSQLCTPPSTWWPCRLRSVSVSPASFLPSPPPPFFLVWFLCYTIVFYLSLVQPHVKPFNLHPPVGSVLLKPRRAFPQGCCRRLCPSWNKAIFVEKPEISQPWRGSPGGVCNNFFQLLLGNTIKGKDVSQEKKILKKYHFLAGRTNAPHVQNEQHLARKAGAKWEGDFALECIAPVAIFVVLGQSLFHCSKSRFGVVFCSSSKRFRMNVRLRVQVQLCLANLDQELLWNHHLGWELWEYISC